MLSALIEIMRKFVPLFLILFVFDDYLGFSVILKNLIVYCLVSFLFMKLYVVPFIEVNEGLLR